MDIKTFDLQLAAIEAPKPSRGSARVAGAKGVPVFLGERHQFMPTVLGLIKNSPTASAMLNRKAALVAGQGFKVNADELPALAKFLKNIASEGRYRTGDKLLKRVAKDYAKLLGVALQIVWAEDRQHIAEIYHQGYKTVAPAEMDADENITEYFICRDWKNTTKYKVQRLPAFDPAKANSSDPEERAANAVQLAVFYEEDADTEYFPDLDFHPGLNYMVAEGLLGEFHPNNISNKFSLGSILAVRNGPADKQSDDGQTVITAEEQQRDFLGKMKKTFTGPKAEQLMVLFGDGTEGSADDMAKLTSYTAGTNETLYESIAKMCQQAILSAGGVTSPEVVGLPSVGGLGSSGEQLDKTYQMYFNTVCRPAQLSLLDFFKEIFAYVPGVDFTNEPEAEPWLDITTTLPVKFLFGEDTLLALCTDAELRVMMDLPATPAAPATVEGAVVTQQSPEQKALAGSVGGQTAIDSMLNSLAQKLTTRESCIARLVTFFGLTKAQAEEIVPLDNETTKVPAGAI
ncbi:MAG TPA: hypothetical protein VF690_01235 [Hymenobacter sp.]|jgi:hypothetical protein